MLSHTFSHPVEQMLAAASGGGGILARYPNLRAAFLEGNGSWLPFFLWRLDEHWERLGDVHAPEQGWRAFGGSRSRSFDVTDL